jgi:2TM domain
MAVKTYESESTQIETKQSEHNRPFVNTGLKAHIVAFVIVNAFLVAAWKLSGVDYPWFLWVLAGWGVGLAFHVFGRSLMHAAGH